MVFSAPPQAPSSLPGLPDPKKTLSTGGQQQDAGEQYPICWSSEGSAGRTKSAILELIQPCFDSLVTTASTSTRRVLEVASGLGEHLKCFAEANPGITFQPTECEPHLVARLNQACENQSNIVNGLQLNVLDEKDWSRIREGLQDGPFDGVVIQNLLHIAPPQVTISLFEQLSSLKRPPLLSPTRGFISIYGAFIDNDEFFSEGDKAFDDHIKDLSPHLGLRDVSRFVEPVARQNGFSLVDRLPGPGGNWILIFRPSSACP